MSAWEVVPDSGRSRLGEGPLWSARDGAVWWVDILGARLRLLTLADGGVTAWDMPEPVCWVIEREAASGFIAGCARGFAELSLDPVALRPIADPEPDLPGNRMNDAKADAAGRIWAGTMAADGRGRHGGFYRLDPDRRWARVDGPYGIANGPAISPDGRTLLHTDSAAGTIYRFALGADGTLGPREVFLRFEDGWGAPDGMMFDANGGLWVAHWVGARVSRFGPDGALDRSIPLPASQITSCTFAGADLDRMFVTSAAEGVDEPLAGALFEVDPGCRGLPTLRFGG